MAGIKSLAKDTAIYGVSSIVGRFLNWCLVPLYTIKFPADEYGVVTYIYAVVALALIILTYGMETGFFRFANHERYSNPDEVYSTSLVSLGVSSTFFFAIVLLFLNPIAAVLNCPGHASYIFMMALAVALDAYTSIPFAYLRYKKRPVRFATLKLINIGLNIGLNLFSYFSAPGCGKWLPTRLHGFIVPISVSDTYFLPISSLRRRCWCFSCPTSCRCRWHSTASCCARCLDTLIRCSYLASPAS